MGNERNPEPDELVAAADSAEAGPPVVAVVGATATGKSQLAIELAGPVGGEVVNADSMQLYRGMDIGTAKVPVSARCGVPHHLLDVWSVAERANVAEYQRLARAAIQDVAGRGALPIVVGGSGLYVRAVLDRMAFPGHDPDVRARWEAALAEVGPEALHAKLAARDPDAAAQILPRNGRRIVRALEVIELTGGPFVAELPAPVRQGPTLVIGLQRDRHELDEALATRVHDMFDAGLVGEARDLAGLAGSPTASRALGYRQALAHLAGEYDEPTARQETIRGTRAFARRQQAWFRRDTAIKWLDATDPDLSSYAQRLVERFRRSHQSA